MWINLVYNTNNNDYMQVYIIYNNIGRSLPNVIAVILQK